MVRPIKFPSIICWQHCVGRGRCIKLYEFIQGESIKVNEMVWGKNVGLCTTEFEEDEVN